MFKRFSSILPNAKIILYRRGKDRNDQFHLATRNPYRYPGKLELNASLSGNLIFQPKDIISLEPYSGSLSRGIRIIHRVPSYNPKVIFWTFKEPSVLINQIFQTGFFSTTEGIITEKDPEIVSRQISGGFPIKKSMAIGFFVLWNSLFLSDFLGLFNSGKRDMFSGPGVSIALGMVFLASILTLLSKSFSKLVLKEGRTIKDINKALYLIILITGFMLLIRVLLHTKGK